MKDKFYTWLSGLLLALIFIVVFWKSIIYGIFWIGFVLGEIVDFEFFIIIMLILFYLEWKKKNK